MEGPSVTTEHIDGLLPPEMALQAERIGVAKAGMPVLKTLVLAILAGSFIALGAVFFTSVTSGSNVYYGLTRLLGGVAFSLGLILVVVGGAELFTGNNLIVMAWAGKKISTLQVIRNWIIVLAGNFIGAVFVAFAMFFSRQYTFASGAVGQNILNIARAKCQFGFFQAVVLGIMCNILVCLAVWLCFSARNASVKILCILFPVTAFVTAGFEHSIANMYFLPIATLILHYGDPVFLGQLGSNIATYDSVTWYNIFVNNLLPVTIGNLIGGAGFVGLVYWFVYLRKPQQ